MFYYYIIYNIIIKKFSQDISNIIFSFLYPKRFLSFNIKNKYKIINYSTNIEQNVILYDNLGQQNCDICGHLEIIVKDKKNINDFKIITLPNKYKCKCNYFI